MICEVDTIHVAKNPPPPAEVHHQEDDYYKYHSPTTNSTYLYSKFKLPWAAAQRRCEEKSGFLAEVETPEENDDLIQRFDAVRFEPGEIVLKLTTNKYYQLFDFSESFHRTGVNVIYLKQYNILQYHFKERSNK